MEELITARELASLLNIDIRTVWRLVKKNSIPQPIRYTRKLVRFRKSEIMEIIPRAGGARIAVSIPDNKKSKERDMILAAYKMADEEQKNVIVVMIPDTKREFTPSIPYFILEEEATDYDRVNGILVTFRIK